MPCDSTKILYHERCFRKMFCSFHSGSILDFTHHSVGIHSNTSGLRTYGTEDVFISFFSCCRVGMGSKATSLDKENKLISGRENE